jgi:ubiquinone/menaquinone biosynthesis C-methylase UbiE
MPWKYTDRQYTEYTRTTWNETARAYASWSDALSPYRQDVVDAIAPRPGERFLDLATGPGEPALTLAGRTGPTGAIVGIDLSREMVALARASARTKGMENATFRTMDCRRLRFPEGSFDGVTSCFGFQIFTDPEGVARESFRVLRPGGRAVASIWGPGESCPLLDAIVGPMLRHAEPDEDGYLPSPYEMGDPGQLVAFFRAAGFVRATEHRVTYTTHFRDATDYFESITRSTPIGHSFREESRKVRTEVRREMERFLRDWTGPSGIDLPSEAVIVRARKPPGGSRPVASRVRRNSARGRTPGRVS